MIKTISKGPSGSNCYICSNDGKAFIVDPGCDIRYIDSYFSENELDVQYIFLTHAHYDHIACLDQVRDKYRDAVVYAFKAESDILPDPVFNGSVFFGLSVRYKRADRYFADNDEIDFCGDKIRIIHTPGHTKGSVCILADGIIFTGDTLFRGGIGRSDLPGGNSNDLYKSLNRLIDLDENCRIFPGHGSSSDIKHEKDNNIWIGSDL